LLTFDGLVIFTPPLYFLLFLKVSLIGAKNVLVLKRKKEWLDFVRARAREERRKRAKRPADPIPNKTA
jgi:hypothetical protein